MVKSRTVLSRPHPPTTVIMHRGLPDFTVSNVAGTLVRGASKHRNHNQWLQIDLGRAMKVTGINTQGRQDTSQMGDRLLRSVQFRWDVLC